MPPFAPGSRKSQTLNGCAALEPVIARYRGSGERLYFRGDAAFGNPEMYEYLEAEDIAYAIRLPANRVLQDRIGYLLKRPVGRPPHEVRRYYVSFSYQRRAGTIRATSWADLFERTLNLANDQCTAAVRLTSFGRRRSGPP